MMVCPRCSFEQPEDRFCANCGLDVVSFRSKPKPLSQRLLSSPIFYGGVAILVGLVLVWWAKQADLPVPSLPRLGLEISTPVAKTQFNETAGGAASATRPEAVSQAQPSSPPTATAGPQGDPPTGRAMVESRIANNDTATPELTAKMPTQLEVSFVELAKDAWNSVAADGKGAGDSGAAHAVAFGNREKLNGVLAVGRKLPGTKQLGIQPASGASMHHQLGPGEPPLGFFYDVTVVRQEGANIEVEVSGQLDLRHDGAPETHQKTEITSQFPLTVGALVIHGLLPRKPVPENLATATQMSPLTALESADFLEGQSEFLLVIQGK